MKDVFEKAYKREMLKKMIKGEYFPEIKSEAGFFISNNCSKALCKICKFRDSNNDTCMLKIEL